MRKVRASAAAILVGAIGVGVVAATGVASPAGAEQPGLAASAAQVASTPGSGDTVSRSIGDVAFFCSMPSLMFKTPLIKSRLLIASRRLTVVLTAYVNAA